jgi:hypothetical protein
MIVIGANFEFDLGQRAAAPILTRAAESGGFQSMNNKEDNAGGDY